MITDAEQVEMAEMYMRAYRDWETGGRKKGVTNKVNAEVKELIRGALDDAGGQEYLVKQAKDNPTAFLALVGKILPKDINAKIEGSISLEMVNEFE